MSVTDAAARAPTATIGRASQLIRRWSRVAFWVLLAVAAGAIVRWWLTAPVAVEVVRLQRGPLVVEAFGTGTLEAKVVVGAGAKMVGKVVDVLVDQGTR